MCILSRLQGNVKPFVFMIGLLFVIGLAGCGATGTADDESNLESSISESSETPELPVSATMTATGIDAVTYCRIDRVRYAAGTVNPDNSCEICDPTRSTKSWSDNDGATCDDGNFCNGEDTCLGGACTHAGSPCEDDGIFCNGEEICVEEYDQCWHAGDPCANDGLFCNGEESCDEENDVCNHTGDPCGDDGLFCNGDEYCDEDNDSCASSGDPCESDGEFCNGTEVCNEENDQCENSGNPCPDDGIYCNGEEICMEDYEQCWHTGNPCPIDDLYCNGEESCNEDMDQCETTGSPCEDDGLFCNGGEECDEENDSCVAVEAPCADDGLYCNGIEVCDEENDLCAHEDEPCPQDDLFCNGTEMCDEDTQECWSTGFPCINGEECSEEQDECSGNAVLVLYDDYDGPWNYGKLFANMTANILSHYGYSYRFLDAEEYQAGDLNGFDYAIYFGTIYAEPVSEAFLQDISDRVAPVFWVNYNFWQIAWNTEYNTDWGFNYIYGVAESSYTNIEYKGELFTKHETYPEYNLIEITDPDRAEVMATLVNESDPTDTAPYVVKGDGIWYCADNPYAWLWDGSRYVVFEDLLGEFLGYTPQHGKRAMVRFEDNAPVVSDSKVLLQIGRKLKNMDVPFGIALIPRFVDPTGYYFEEPVDYGLDDDPDFVDALLDLQDMGGTIILHGYTHQYDTATGDDWEFWLEDVNTPVPEDSVQWVQGRLDAALEECHAHGIYPVVWETPHYSASQLDYEVFYQNFDTSYERIRVFNNFNSNPQHLLREADSSKAKSGMPVTYPALVGAENLTLNQIRSRSFLAAGVKVPSSQNAATEAGDEDTYTLQFVNFGVPETIYGHTWVCENMGYIDPGVVTPDDLLALSQKYSVLSEPVSSFFYHHDYPVNYLTETINGLIDQGYEFVSAQELKDSMLNP